MEIIAHARMEQKTECKLKCMSSLRRRRREETEVRITNKEKQNLQNKSGNTINEDKET